MNETYLLPLSIRYMIHLSQLSISAFDIFLALSKWACYSLPDRQDLVGGMMAECIRLDDMDVLQLQQLRQTQLVRNVEINPSC